MKLSVSRDINRERETLIKKTCSSFDTIQYNTIQYNTINFIQTTNIVMAAILAAIYIYFFQ